MGSSDLECAGQTVGLSAENLRIVLSHLIDNARHHGATRIDLVAEADADRLDLIVQDDGSGISPSNRTRIFDSFFTTRRDVGGTGMGLSIARAMLTAYGGAIALLDNANGAAFRLTIPLASRTGDA